MTTVTDIPLSGPGGPNDFDRPARPPGRPRLTMVAGILATLGLVLGLLWLGFSLVYAGKVYPGVSAAGAYLGGLDRDQAITAIAARTDEYERVLIPVEYDNTTFRISPAKLGLTYNAEKLAEAALSHGRRGGWWSRLHQQVRALAGRPTEFAAYRYDDAKLAPYLARIDTDLNRPVRDASFHISGGSVTVNPDQPGRRLDLAGLVRLLNQRLANTSDAPIRTPAYPMPPLIDTASAQAVQPRAAEIVGQPVKLSAAARQFVITEAELASWLKLERTVPRNFAGSGGITAFYAAFSPVSLSVDEAKINQYVAELAAKIDQPGQNAVLTITDGRATVFKPSRDGVQLDRPRAVADLRRALAGDGDRELRLAVKVSKPEITEASINDLGIKELISEGVSFFPGSTPERVQNVRTGAARYNGVLLKPGEVFSFGALLGDVSAATGYAPAKVIIGNRQELQYGGGLCQVSSTAYRAALNAGLPILQRVNHSFAINYYTAPYGVPGVDATVYYPQVDMKFKNDTHAHILIQTVIEGSTLKFQFYGTKTKEGRIRGPEFIEGSLDATKPSKTVFYRDVLVDGQVVKTDRVFTSYKSSKEFPDKPQFN
ncbi:VanW family protein [Candidatus Parcubacteria bacterium]|nr:VanW family protein [Candidatus Parcubacteria bacterium]